ncbi:MULTISPECIES: DUF3726 domain-containing protein [unclassified Psychrobacter]|uniref:DUF3726 domain-containing protein n=1 Tax=unclassified Psychrobacter TaxID=196806 RepID=UPI0007141C4E|nr:DUF3726 domain-containing protein [Psychrobacter sp. P11F6]KRG32537.1 hypothetical protein AK822_13485 [Psychrobacter sp. P11F6]
MIVSHNEIVTIVHKAFTGMHREVGEADVIATMVAELQMAGLDGIRHFNNASPYILTEHDTPIDIVHQQDGAIRLDLHGSSLACHLPTIIDYALEKMGDLAHFHIYLQNCHNRWLAYSELVGLAAKGFACLAKWDNGSVPKHTLFTLNQGFVYPDLYFFDQAQANYNTNDMIIEIATQNFDIEQDIQHFNHKISTDELFETHQRAWKEGIYVDDEQWAILKKTAAAMLVDNSETSSKGAGGA